MMPRGKMKKKKVKFIYTFEIEYEHEKHLNNILRDLKKAPIFEMSGAGIVDGSAVSYSCNRIGYGVEST